MQFPWAKCTDFSRLDKRRIVALIWPLGGVERKKDGDLRLPQLPEILGICSEYLRYQCQHALVVPC